MAESCLKDGKLPGSFNESQIAADEYNSVILVARLKFVTGTLCLTIKLIRRLYICLPTLVQIKLWS